MHAWDMRFPPAPYLRAPVFAWVTDVATLCTPTHRVRHLKTNLNTLSTTHQSQSTTNEHSQRSDFAPIPRVQHHKDTHNHTSCSTGLFKMVCAACFVSERYCSATGCVFSQQLRVETPTTRQQPA